MRPQTERLRLEFFDSIGRASELVRSIDDLALRRRPAHDSWCAAECIEHLSATTEVCTTRIREALRHEGARPAREGERITLRGRIFLRYLEPPVRRKFIASTELVPRAVNDRYTLMKRFDQSHRGMLGLIEETDPIDRMRVRVHVPMGEWVTFTVLDAFALLAAHDRRHLWQAERAARV